MPYVPTESIEQRNLVLWLRRVRPDLLFWHTPNGGSRSVREGAQLRSEGVQAGIPDLFLMRKVTPGTPAAPVAPPRGLEGLADTLRGLFHELAQELPLGHYTQLLRSIGIGGVVGLELKSLHPSAGLDEKGNQDRWIRDLSVSGVPSYVARGAEAAKVVIKEAFGG